METCNPHSYLSYFSSEETDPRTILHEKLKKGFLWGPDLTTDLCIFTADSLGDNKVTGVGANYNTKFFPEKTGIGFSHTPFIPSMEELSRRGKVCDLVQIPLKKDLKKGNELKYGDIGSETANINIIPSGISLAATGSRGGIKGIGGYANANTLAARNNTLSNYRKKKVQIKETAAAFKAKQMTELELTLGKKHKYEQSRKQINLRLKNSRYNMRSRIFVEWSIPEQFHWELINSTSFSELNKLTPSKDINISQVKKYGNIPIYRKKLDQIIPKNKFTIPTKKNYYNYYSPTSSQDPILNELAANSTDETIKVLITNDILAALMSATHSIFSFHFKIFRDGNTYTFEESDHPSALTLLTVNECSPDSIFNEAVNATETNPTALELFSKSSNFRSSTPITRSLALGLETVHVNKVARQQLFEQDTTNHEKKMYETHGYPHVLPPSRKGVFIQDAETPFAPGGLRYCCVETTAPVRIIHEDNGAEIMNKKVKIFYRSDISAVQRITLPDGSENFENIYIATITEPPKYSTTSSTTVTNSNDTISKVENSHSWGSTIDNQLGAFLASEIKNNICKMRKFLASAMLADCKKIKLLFAARKFPLTLDSHTVNLIQSYDTELLARQIDFNFNESWSIVKHIIAEIIKFGGENECEFVVIRDVSMPALKIFTVTNNREKSDSQEHEY